MNLVYRPVCVRPVGAVAVKVEHHGVGAGQLLHAAAGVGGQHEPRPQPGTRPAPAPGTAPGDVEVTRAVLLTLYRGLDWLLIIIALALDRLNCHPPPCKSKKLR